MDHGNSFSGHEPNCAFLNAGDGTFATVSAISGFDFADDARSVALTDWDGDGDLDAWITNRTAPMLRYLRNDMHGGESFRLLLEGTTSARDAAGARVEVRLRGQPDRPVVQTVKLGEGFLGQSSRWLHFGLGKGTQIESVRVTWPGGKVENVPCSLESGGWMKFKQGAAEGVAGSGGFIAWPRKPSPLTPRSAQLAGAVTLFQPMLFPPLPSTTPDGKPWSVTDNAGPVLINLFASWCPDCARELTAWREAAAQFKAAGVNLALLTADGRDTAHATGPADAWAWLKKNNIPFPAGMLSDEAFRRLNAAHRQLFGAVVSLPIPTSFLLDGKGRLIAVYRGPVEWERILRDVKSTGGALPYPGTWLTPPESPDPSFWVVNLGAQKQWRDAGEFFLRHREAILPHRNYTAMAGALAQNLAAAGEVRAAILINEAALARTADPAVLNNLASLLASAPDKSLRQPARALTLAQQASAATGDKVPAILETLAAAHAVNGDFKSAAATAARALPMARASGDAALSALLEKALAAYTAGHMPD